ncbi:MAG: group III truncated hemoglobin [Bacteroidetes bacterium]|nr:group III truncated hemoglobin [Bacteroidota bacterium]
MNTDIEHREDIMRLVNTFYEKVKQDEVIGYIFNDIANVNWEKHLPVMYDFWENAIFYTGAYRGDPMNIHRNLHHLTALTKAHFDRWNTLFLATVDELFSGEKAELAKQRALSISTVLQSKILYPDPNSLL